MPYILGTLQGGKHFSRACSDGFYCLANALDFSFIDALFTNSFTSFL
jgi:hypothetical protein